MSNKSLSMCQGCQGDGLIDTFFLKKRVNQTVPLTHAGKESQ